MTDQGESSGFFANKQGQVFYTGQRGGTIAGEFFQRLRSWATKEQLREYFEVRFRAEKYGVPYFLAESEAKQSGPRKEAAGARARNAVEDLNVQVIRSYSWAAAESQKNSQCKPVNNCGGSRDYPWYGRDQ